MNRILVTGGAGYIGSHTSRQLIADGHHVAVLDNLHRGNKWAVPQAAHFTIGDIADQPLVEALLKQQKIDTVLHFAGHVVVPESVANPAQYYRNNVLGSFNLLEACLACGVEKFVFSSSAAVYGLATHQPVAENATKAPLSPYGHSKLMTEYMLQDLANASSTGFKFVALRYFNVAGACLDGTLGQDSQPATHLLKVACQAACGLIPKLQIFGDDYPTADGTCIRDYIHVEDLARAHLDALAYLQSGDQSLQLNCGYGHGYSVKQVVECMQAVSNVDFAVTISDRRVGDPPQLVADNKLIKKHLHWKPRYDDLTTICRSAYQWEQKLLSRANSAATTPPSPSQ